MSDAPYLRKKLAKEGDWCSCCGCLVEPKTEMIVLQTDKGSRQFTKEHLLDWINAPGADILLPQHPKDRTEPVEGY